MEGAVSDSTPFDAKEKRALEYLVFLTVVLVVVGLCVLVAVSVSRRPAGWNATDGIDLKVLRRRIDGRSGHATPWGWPGARNESSSARHAADDGLTDALGRWVEAVLAQKRTVDDDPDFQRRQQASIRALVEDRYGGGRGSTPRSRNDSLRADVRPAPSRNRAIGSQVKTPWGW